MGLDKIEVIREALGRQWSPPQREIVYCDAREVLVGGGERAGKSLISADYFNVRSDVGNLYWIAAKDYERCEQEFRYIADAMIKLGWVLPDDVHMPKNNKWWMKFWAVDRVVETFSLGDWLKVGSKPPDGIIIAEVAQITQPEYQRLCDRTAEKRGWVMASGTFESSLGWYPELWKQYQLSGQNGVSFSMPTWSNTVVFPEGEADPEIQRLKEKHPHDYFMERFGGVPCPPKGLVFPEFRTRIHVKPLSVVEGTQIGIAIDPGYAAAYAVLLVQIVNDTIYVLDEVYIQGATTEEVITICKQKWASYWKPDYGVVDIAAKQHQAMPAVIEVWLKMEGIRLSCQKVKEPEGRERLHTFLKVNPLDNQPRLFIDPKCTGLLSELGGAPNPFTHEAAPYRWKEDRAGNVIGISPDDRNNHAIKALTYLIIDKFGHVDRRKNQVYHQPHDLITVR